MRDEPEQEREGRQEAPRVEILPPERPESRHTLPLAPSPPPSTLEHAPLPSFRRLSPLPLLALLLLSLILGYAGWQRLETRLPPGFVAAAGRIEADPIDIAAKFPGRVAALLADEGDWVRAGQVVARMDTRDLEAELAREEAQILQAERNRDQVAADLGQQKARLLLAEQEFRRAEALYRSGNGPKEVLDQRQSQLAVARAQTDAALARLGRAEHAIEAARQDAALTRVNLADDALTAPVDGRIEYRLGNPGEVLAAGGKVFTMLDAASIHMDVFLPTGEAGRVRVGTEARILLDDARSPPLPARVSAIAGESQFSPKPVETEAERAKLMFRIRLRLDPEPVHARAEMLRTGLPGTAYLRADPMVQWPEFR